MTRNQEVRGILSHVSRLNGGDPIQSIEVSCLREFIESHDALEAENARLKEAYEKHYLPGIAAADLHSELAEKRISDLEAEVEALRGALTELRAVVRGECPHLLSEDSGGNAKLAMQIDAALGETQ
jgi:hypothetical protein